STPRGALSCAPPWGRSPVPAERATTGAGSGASPMPWWSWPATPWTAGCCPNTRASVPTSRSPPPWPRSRGGRGPRRAVQVRDRGCVWPGCHRPASWGEVHHLRHWAQGGSTDLDNLVTICRAHHWKVHEGGWRLIRSDEGMVVLPPVPLARGARRGWPPALPPPPESGPPRTCVAETPPPPDRASPQPAAAGPPRAHAPDAPPTV